MAKKKEYFVYRIDLCGYYYYGMTHSIEKRKKAHSLSIFLLIKNGRYLLEHTETGALHFHHLVARFLVKNNKPYSLAKILNSVYLREVYSTTDQDECKEVETFLIQKSLKRHYCANRKYGCKQSVQSKF